ncbi:adenine nucleotide alpha hydrolase [Sulfitobacter sp. M13]
MTLSAALHAALAQPASLTIALSGGIDSLTLSAAAAKVRGAEGVTLCHAVSAAVPSAATARVKDFAATWGVPLKLVDAGEFADPSYRANPVNRCYFCKSNLYGTLARMGPLVAAGTNTDDLSDYRPGLQAAAEHGVACCNLSSMRRVQSRCAALARELGWGNCGTASGPPVWPAGSMTGLRVEPADLAVIDRVETLLCAELGNITLRCRLLRGGWVVELDPRVYEDLSTQNRRLIIARVRQATDDGRAVNLRAYSRGSAFVHQ